MPYTQAKEVALRRATFDSYEMRRAAAVRRAVIAVNEERDEQIRAQEGGSETRHSNVLAFGREPNGYFKPRIYATEVNGVRAVLTPNGLQLAHKASVLHGWGIRRDKQGLLFPAGPTFLFVTEEGKEHLTRYASKEFLNTKVAGTVAELSRFALVYGLEVIQRPDIFVPGTKESLQHVSLTDQAAIIFDGIGIDLFKKIVVPQVLGEGYDLSGL